MNEKKQADRYMVWSNEHRAWWKANETGYSQGMREAGRYTREHALEICRKAIPTSMHIGLISEIPVREADVVEFLQDQLIPKALFEGNKI